uniref:Uncharacterized protein n=1 Tax=Podoviridae sp. ctXdu7 TaxID=2827618 RepID=A0A8S5RR55_9CAUD|nr:MAG TPA: hypothetical protein [Podoviridae sp. ctXdu7]
MSKHSCIFLYRADYINLLFLGGLPFRTSLAYVLLYSVPLLTSFR